MAGKNGVDLEVEVVDNTELQDSSSKDSGQQPRRIPKCSGCKLPHEGHTWADPGPYCTGPSDEHTDAVGKNTDAVGEPKDQRDEEQALVEQLHKLTMAEQAIEKANRIDQLKLAIAESHKRIMDLKQKRPLSSNQTKPSLDDSLPPTIPLSSSSQAAASGSGSGSSSTVPVYSSLSTGAIPSLAAGMAGFRPGTSGTSGTRGTSHVTPLDGLLADYLPGAAPQWHVNNPDGSLAPPHAAQESRMFLKPAQLAKGEQILRIIDFIDKIVSNAEDRTLSEIGAAKLVVSYGPKKPKLESVTIAQWVIANTRIFHTLLSAGKLPSPQDVQHYLAYTIKIMELSTKFTWSSVLKYDDEFRHVQAVYNYPWSYDFNHLHTVLLEPLTVIKLIGDEDEAFLTTGIRNGFQLAPPDSKFLPAQQNNYKSATNASSKAAVEQTILEEIAEGNYVVTNCKPTIVSALGAIPKPDSAEVRIIHDCSRPIGRGLNDYIQPKSFQFQTLDDAIKLLGPNYFLAKIDLRHAYRSVPIHHTNFAATGLRWQFQGHDHFTYLYDTRLPFGAKSSPEIFHRLTQSLRRMMAKRGFHAVVVYLDDFLVIGKTEAECQMAFNTLLQLLQDLGFRISWHKVVQPTQKLVFLGVELDTMKCEMALPQDKLEDLHKLVSAFLSRSRATKKQLQSLAGKLNWACRGVYGGRTFLRRILDMMNSLPSNATKYRLSSDFHADIRWWHSFLRQFNGRCPFLKEQPITDVHTDACPLAAGAYFRGDWFYHNFAVDSPEHAPLHINYKEVLAQTLAASRWAPYWRNQHVIIHSDNVAAVHIINKGSTSNPLVMCALRNLFWLSANYNFRFTAVHIPGKSNVLADAVSRLHQPAQCLFFYQHLLSLLPQFIVDTSPLSSHMSDDSTRFLFCRCTGPYTGQAVRRGDFSFPFTHLLH
ncbi:hypothetical protein ACROYT_G010257 [Oculina patagonica]